MSIATRNDTLAAVLEDAERVFPGSYLAVEIACTARVTVFWHAS